MCHLLRRVGAEEEEAAATLEVVTSSSHRGLETAPGDEAISTNGGPAAAAASDVVVVVIRITDQEDAMVLVEMSSDEIDRLNTMIVPGSATSRRLKTEVNRDAVEGEVMPAAEVVGDDDDDCESSENEFVDDTINTEGFADSSGSVPTRALLSAIWRGIEVDDGAAAMHNTCEVLSFVSSSMLKVRDNEKGASWDVAV